MKRLLLATCLILVGFGGWGVADAHMVLADGNSDAAHQCQDGGYVHYMRADGSRFADVGACVSYAAQGGQLIHVPPSITVTRVVCGTSPVCGGLQFFFYFVVTGKDFTPNSRVDLTTTEVLLGGFCGGGPCLESRTVSLTSDATGSFTTTFLCDDRGESLSSVSATDVATGSTVQVALGLNCAL